MFNVRIGRILLGFHATEEKNFFVLVKSFFFYVLL